MAIQVSKMPDEPLILISIMDQMALEDVHAAWAQTATLAASAGKTYRIIDMTHAQMDFGTLVMLLADATHGSENLPGSPLDPRFVDYVVALPQSLAALGMESIKQEQYGSQQVPVFVSLDEALACAREQIARG